ncbi:hypothetical protein KC19_2G031100 [Ceratodon purpureus]|uniref:GIL1/IRKI C-terminal domain-containing protein n=1 Tax=Ceratodon purpureus TaxID=3225 RepID=A0A8T0ITK0_CERPU|nr:hypothetical protein KC19_2G031100 [Ceratodon purpureus]
MTGEVKDGSRKRWHQRSKSTIGDFTAAVTAPIVEPKDVLQKAPSTKGKVTGKDYGRSWFKSKKAQVKESDSSEHPESTDLEVEEKTGKPVQRVVQGLYRDDDGGPSPKILLTSHSAARDAIKEFSKDFLAQLKANPDGCVAMEAQMRQHFSLDPEFPQSDLKFLVQAYIAHHFFADFENASFGIRNPGERPWEVQQHMLDCFEQFQKYKTKTQTVLKLLENELNDTFLSKFCMKKYKTLVSLDSGGSFFGGDSQHHLDFGKEVHSDTPFYRSFLGAAVSIWLLQRLAFSFEQKIVTIYPTGGDEFQRRFMEPVVPGIGDTEDEDCDVDLEIVFTVFPGFRVSESIVESSVYIIEKPKTEYPASTSIENGAPEESQSASKELEDPASPSVGNGAAEVGQTATKESRFAKLYSLPASISAKLSESSAIKASQKSSFSKDASNNKEGEHGGLFQKIISKITRKKGHGKDKTGDDASTIDAGESTAALSSLEEVKSLHSNH